MRQALTGGVVRIAGLPNAGGQIVFYITGTQGTATITPRALPVGSATPASGSGPVIRVMDLTLAAETYVVGTLTTGKLYKVQDAGGLDFFLDVVIGTGTGLVVEYFTTE